MSKDGVQMLEDYIKKVPKWPRPTSCKKMSSFLGFQYINELSFQGTLTNCINSMKEGLKFEWSEDMEKDFKELKAEFTAGKIQAYLNFDSSEPFILTTD